MEQQKISLTDSIPMKQAKIDELLEAIALRDFPRVSSIIDAEIEVNQQENQAFNISLAKAINSDRPHLVQQLLAAGAIPNRFIMLELGDILQKTRYKLSQMMAAAISGSIKAVKLLLSAGAEVNVADNQGDTPFILARDAEHNEVVELLKEAGATE